MATFTADPRIAYAQGMRKNYLQRALSPIDLSENLYGGSPLASALQRVTEGYLAGQEGRRAAELQKAQSSAQNQILGSLLGASRARTPAGGQYFEQFQAPVPGIAPGPGATQTQIRRVAIGDDGREVPVSSVSAENLQIAGMDPIQFKMLYDDARIKGDAATQAALEKELKVKLGEASNALALNPNDENAYNKVQQIRALLDPSGFATEVTKVQDEQKRFDRQQKATIDAERRKLGATIDAEKRALGRELSAKERAAINWEAQQVFLRTNRNEDTIDAENRELARLIEAEKRRTGREINSEGRAHLEWVAREEINQGRVLSAEERAKDRVERKENRALLATMEREKRALAAEIAKEKRRLNTTLSSEQRAAIAYKVQARFNDERARIKAETAAKLTRITVYSAIDGSKDSITQEMMDDDQNAKTPEYTYDESDKPGFDDVNFRVTEPFTYKGVAYEAGDEFLVNLRDPAFEKHENKGVKVQISKTEATRTPLEANPKIGTGSIAELAGMFPEGADSLLLEDMSAGDIGGVFSRTGTAITGILGLDPPWPSAERTQEEGAQLKTIGTFIMANLARSISSRVPVWTQAKALELVPQPGSSNSTNAKRIKALIPELQRRYRDIQEAVDAGDKDLDFNAAASTLANLEITIPLLAQSLTAYESQSDPGIVKLNPGSSFSAEDAASAPVGTIVQDSAGLWRKKSNAGRTGEWEKVN